MKIKDGDLLLEHHYYPDFSISFVMSNPIYKTMKVLIDINDESEGYDIMSSLVYTKTINNWIRAKSATILIHWEI